ncbi:MAG TPA: hypothetical protein VGX28_15425 [Frankiaceae bacterium]|jgi:hypothetical protein|nr:hypothetical protein [Frankiaceae bacterium]
MTEPARHAVRWAERENARRHAAYRRAHEAWASDDAVLAGFADRVRSGPSGEAPPGVVLKRGEHLVQVLSGIRLVECARTPGHYVRGYAGFSYRVTKNLRYSMGGSRGTYVPGPEVLKVKDSGVAVVTTQRVVFQGGLKTREWAFGKLVGYAHDETSPYTALHVTNRQNVSGLLYEPAAAPYVHFALALALAAFQGETAPLLAALEAERAAHAAARPVPPPVVTPEDAPGRPVLHALRVAYIGRPGHSLARKVTQGVIVGTLTLGALGAVLPEPPAEKAASRTVAAESAPPAVVTTPSAEPTPEPTAEPAVAAPPPTTAPAPRPTTAPPAPRPTTARPAARPTRAQVVVRATTRPPAPKPAVSTCGAAANPWGYNHCGRGSYISSPPSSFCSYFDCIPSFWESTNGYVMRCDDGMYSHSGGRQGSCSHHGGNDEPLYG